jgi:hypothetical protein
VPLSTSDTLGPHKILATIAVGGMGELYGARSTGVPVFT